MPNRFEVIPAIDLRGGRCVRLYQGDFQQETIYSDDPASQADRWIHAGATRLHVVDLDAARGDSSMNRDAIAAIARRGVPVQLGGGMRTVEAIQAAIDLGIDRVVAGTAIVEDSGFLEAIGARFGDRIVAGIDVRDGLVATRGWREQTALPAEDLARRAAAAGVGAIITTDISRDGAFSGPNLDLVRSLMAASGLPVIASGGIASVADLIAARDAGAAGAITGKAIYDGRIDLREALAACILRARR